jgi:hypothetical protein
MQDCECTVCVCKSIVNILKGNFLVYIDNIIVFLNLNKIDYCSSVLSNNSMEQNPS